MVIFSGARSWTKWTEILHLMARVPRTCSTLFKPAVKPFDVFISMKRVEWDTLMFFYGIMLCVGGLGALGYLATLSDVLYGGLAQQQRISLSGFFQRSSTTFPSCLLC